MDLFQFLGSVAPPHTASPSTPIKPKYARQTEDASDSPPRSPIHLYSQSAQDLHRKWDNIKLGKGKRKDEPRDGEKQEENEYVVLINHHSLP